MRTVDGREVVWEGQPRQAVALACPALEAGYAGTKGAGKTDFLVMCPGEQITLCHQKYLATGRKQRGRYIIFRKNVKNLADIIQRAEELYPLVDPGAKWNVMEKRWTFTSGYKVDFAHLDGPNDHLGYNGQELTGIGFDQVEEIPEEVYRFLTMQVRSKDADMRKLLFVRVTANPGGPHAAWVKKYFIEGCRPHNTIIKSSVTLRNGKKREVTKAFIPATLYDNKYLAQDGAYEATLLALPEHLRRMYLEGDWDVVIGAYFSHVWNRSLHVIPSFSIPAHWEIKFGLDWGTTAPSCTLWGARDGEGNVYIIDELYGPGITGRTYGEKMLKRLELQKWSVERKWGVKDMYGFIDRGAMAATGADSSGPSTPAAGIQWCGWRIFPANKDRAAGNEQVLERLLTKANGKPSLYIFGDRCPNLVRTIPALMSDPHNPEDVDTNGDDHCLAGDTLVSTSRGLCRIDDLVGRSGLAIGAHGEQVRFSNVRLARRDAEMITVRASDGRTVTCTPDHKVLTVDGWKEAGSLTLKDQLHCVTLERWKTQGRFLRRNSRTPGSIGTSADSISSAAAFGSIVESGQMLMARLLGAFTSITSMATGQTTDLQISYANSGASTFQSILASQIQGEAQQRRGTLAYLQALQMPNSPSSYAERQLSRGGKMPPYSRAHVDGAGTNTRPGTLERRTSATAPVETVSVVGLVSSPAGNVYDLTVHSDDHAFAVNGGIVVHNCFDTLKYLLLGWPVKGTRPKDKNGDQDVERWLAMAQRRKDLQDAPGDTITTGYGD